MKKIRNSGIRIRIKSKQKKEQKQKQEQEQHADMKKKHLCLNFIYSKETEA
jgi:hypothetical protein